MSKNQKTNPLFQNNSGDDDTSCDSMSSSDSDITDSESGSDTDSDTKQKKDTENKKKNKEMKKKTDKTKNKDNQEQQQKKQTPKEQHMNQSGHPQYGGKGVRPQFGMKGVRPQFGGKGISSHGGKGLHPTTGGKGVLINKRKHVNDNDDESDSNDEEEEEEKKEKPVKTKKKRGKKSVRLNGIQLYPYKAIKSKISQDISADEILAIFVPYENSPNIDEDIIALKYSSRGNGRPGFISEYQFREYSIVDVVAMILKNAKKDENMKNHIEYKDRIIKALTELDQSKYKDHLVTMGRLRSSFKQTLHFKQIEGQKRVISNKNTRKKKKRKKNKSNGSSTRIDSDNDGDMVESDIEEEKIIKFANPETVKDYIKVQRTIEEFYSNSMHAIDLKKTALKLDYQTAIADLRNKTPKEILNEYEKIKKNSL